MDNHLASEQLQVIRTLMERSALYRRALAPIMIVAGTLGLAAAGLARVVMIESNRDFSLFWIAVGLTALIASYLLVRRQAIKDSEPFWSPPTRRVSQALFPGFLVGLAAAAAHVIRADPNTVWTLAMVWILAYGCALHAAGFFMPRGIKLFGWGFVLAGCTLLVASCVWPPTHPARLAHDVMGFFFGLLHLIYGVYLYFTEQRKPDA